LIGRQVAQEYVRVWLLLASANDRELRGARVPIPTPSPYIISHTSKGYLSPPLHRTSSLTPAKGIFKFVDIIYDQQGQEKERRPHLIRKSNLNDHLPIKTGKRLPITQAFTDFVFRYTYQIVHEDSVTMEFLFNIAQELHQNQEVDVVGAGTKGNQPLVIREKGSPYRGFLYGEIGQGENEGKYKLLLLLSDRELKIVDE
jgi:hypothetical protein